ncbi:ABC transporter permease [Lactococcus lactis]|uniref:ABC transporter permease n=1 Tax=Lactococcus lactis TaxID=1358 RepID=UPI0015D4B920|nr:ABC transporter permease [Lactococcus lactis]GFO79140.1 ABC transporter permease [Lactococcus lactis]
MKTINKIIIREFKVSLGRFLSVSALLTLGVFVLIGLNVTGPNMRKTAQKEYELSNLADARISSTIPISENTQSYLTNLKEIKKIEFSFTTDTLLENTSKPLRVESLPDTLSKIKITEGRQPHNKSEIILSDNLKNDFKLNEKIKVQSPKSSQSLEIKNSELKVVGFATSSEYLKKDKIGQTGAGNGVLDGYSYVVKDAFKDNRPNFARIDLKNLKGRAYSEEYEKKSSDIVASLQKNLNKQNSSRIEESRKEIDDQIKTANDQINTGKNNLNIAQEQVNNGLNQINAAKIELQNSQNELNQNIEKAESLQQANTLEILKQKQLILNDQNQEILSKERKLSEENELVEQNKLKIQKLEDKVNQAQESKNNLSNISLLIANRNDYNDGYNNYGEDTERIDALGKTFPILFFLIAILVSFTTMRRMVEEKRIEMGTLRALGYSKSHVMREFLLYSTSAALVGTVIGSILGLIALPQIIFKAYSANFTFEKLTLDLHPWYILLGLLISLFSTVLASWLAARKELKELPALLMIPKPPKDGSRILLERITPIWKRMSFSHKVTARNLLRYKSRMFMTIIGVAGATALMITGFGIRESLNSIVEKQFGSITKYDVIAVYNTRDTKKNVTEVKNKVKNNKDIAKYTDVYFYSVYSKQNGDSVRQNISLIVPSDASSFDKYTSLRDYQTDQQLNLNSTGAVISEKLSKVENVKPGDNLTILDSFGKSHNIKVSAITKMYAGHYIYMNQSYYKSVYGEIEPNNSYLISLKDSSNKSVNKFSIDFNSLDSSISTIQSEEVKSTIKNILNNLNNLILVVVVAASLLSMVVLYTLININVSERIRELSTLKVLGFYPKEVLMYIYREANILTGFGILFGLGIGYIFHGYVMSVLPPASSMVAPGLSWINIFTSIFLTIIFSLVIMMIMNRKIQKVDMLEALKSVD